MFPKFFSLSGFILITISSGNSENGPSSEIIVGIPAPREWFTDAEVPARVSVLNEIQISQESKYCLYFSSSINSVKIILSFSCKSLTSFLIDLPYVFSDSPTRIYFVFFVIFEKSSNIFYNRINFFCRSNKTK